MVNLNFQQPLILTLVSQDPSEIIQICWFDAQETFIIIIIIVLLIFCVKTMIFGQDSLLKRKFREQHLFKHESFVI